MLRRFQIIFLTACFVIALLAIVLWIKSYLRSDTLCWDHAYSSDPAVRRTQWGVQSRRGQIVVGRLDYLPKRRYWRLGPLGSDVTDGVWYRAAAAPLDWIGPTNRLSEYGFAWRHTVSGVWPTVAYPTRLDDLTIITFPHWAIVLLSAPWPVIAFKRWRRLRRRKRKGFCLHCGYDLQGITSERCPECGTNVHASTPSPLVGEGRGEG